MSESSFRETTVSQAMNIYASLVFVVLWVGFIGALVVNPTWLEILWNWVQALPMVTKIIVWVLFLPIMATLSPCRIPTGLPTRPTPPAVFPWSW